MGYELLLSGLMTFFYYVLEQKQFEFQERD